MQQFAWKDTTQDAVRRANLCHGAKMSEHADPYRNRTDKVEQSLVFDQEIARLKKAAQDS